MFQPFRITVAQTSRVAAVAAFCTCAFTTVSPPAQAQGLVYPWSASAGSGRGMYGNYLFTRVIHSAASYDARLSGDTDFSVVADGRGHAVTFDTDGNYLFTNDLRGTLETPDGVTLSVNGDLWDASGAPVSPKYVVNGMYRTPGGYELSYDGKSGARTLRTPEGRFFSLETVSRQMYPSGLYYD